MCIVIRRFNTEEEITIQNCEGLVREFVRDNVSIVYYDILPVSSDFQLPRDVLVLTAMSRINPNPDALRELWNQRKDIDESLQRINTGISLIDDAFPEVAIKDILGKFLAITGIGVAFTSKILHKKRPELFPIIDSKVRKIYGFPANETPDAVIEWIKHMREDVRENRKRLEQLREIANEEVAERANEEGWGELRDNISFSLLRIFDIVLWQYHLEQD